MASETVQLSETRNHLAPDCSEIRELVQGTRGSMAHCTLPVGAVAHRNVEEI